MGGVDSLCLTTLYGFHSLQLSSLAPCRPFDIARDGISIGEAGAFALLERVSDRVQSDSVLLHGVGESSDAYHMSAPHPEGLGAKRAMLMALAAAAMEPGDIDYINLHGTGTPSNDRSESQAVTSIFGPTTPCSSTKGATGHTLARPALWKPSLQRTGDPKRLDAWRCENQPHRSHTHGALHKENRRVPWCAACSVIPSVLAV